MRGGAPGGGAAHRHPGEGCTRPRARAHAHAYMQGALPGCPHVASCCAVADASPPGWLCDGVGVASHPRPTASSGCPCMAKDPWCVAPLPVASRNPVTLCPDPAMVLAPALWFSPLPTSALSPGTVHEPQPPQPRRRSNKRWRSLQLGSALLHTRQRRTDCANEMTVAEKSQGGPYISRPAPFVPRLQPQCAQAAAPHVSRHARPGGVDRRGRLVTGEIQVKFV